MTDEQQQHVQEQPPGLPRWVKIAGTVVGILILVLVIAMLAGGNHGPGRHNLVGFARPGQPLAFTIALVSTQW